MTDYDRLTDALEQATSTIQDLRFKLDIAQDALEEYADHVLFDMFEWAKQPAIKALERINK